MFDDQGSDGDIHYYQDQGIFGVTGPVVGTFEPDARNIDSLFNTPAALGAEPRTAFLSTFNALDASGNWTLYVEDMFGDTSQYILESWSITVTGDDGMAVIPEASTGIPLLVLMLVGSWRFYTRRK